MVRHMSLFRMSPVPKNGKTTDENIAALKEQLTLLPEKEPSILGCRVLVGVDSPPDSSEDDPVVFTQLAHQLDFKNHEDVVAYQDSHTYKEILEFAKDMVDKVVAIDFEI